MGGLYTEIESSIKILIEGLKYNFIQDADLDTIDPEKMKSLAKSKIEALSGAKKIIDRWLDSPNKPSDKKIRGYITDIINAGEGSINLLRKALRKDIDFSQIEAHKHAAALASKPVILESIFDIDNNLTELRDKLQTGDLTFKEREFTLGYPELYAKGALIKKQYYKKKLNDDGDVILDANSTQGERVVIDGLGIILPKKPRKATMLYYDLPKEEQFWKRVEVPNITTSNVEEHKDFII